MSDSFYVRIRGRVSGPFEVAQLKSMIQRGRFSRIHEVSVDGSSWQAASDVAVLFPGRAKSQPESATEGQAQNEREPKLQDEHIADEQWYYTVNGQRQGPVSMNQLAALAGQAVVGPDAMVWRSGMADWQPAKTVPDLAMRFSAGGGPPSGDQPVVAADGPRNTTAQDRDTILAAARPNGWILFLVLFAFAFSAFMIVFGIWLTASGFEEGRASGLSHWLSAKQKIRFGLSSLVLGSTAMFGGYLLNGLRTAVKNFADTERKLSRVFDNLQSFVVYVSILSIIYLAWFIWVVIEAVSVGGASVG